MSQFVYGAWLAANHLGPSAAGVLQLQEMLVRFFNISVSLAFFATAYMLIWAGIKFITAAGDPKTLQQVWQQVTWALMGIVFLALAWIFLRAIESFTGAPVSSQFCLGFPGAPTFCPFNR